MLKLNNRVGSDLYLSADTICRIEVAGTGSQWHGVRSYVHLRDGGVIECGQDADTVARLIEAEKPSNASQQSALAELYGVVAQILDAGYMNTEDLARLRAAYERA